MLLHFLSNVLFCCTLFIFLLIFIQHFLTFSVTYVLYLSFFTRYFITIVDLFYFLILYLLHLNLNFDALYSFY